MPERTYSEREVAAILRRAAERQGASEEPAPVGLTLAELQDVGRASGIAPEQIAAAAAELAGRPQASRRGMARVLGGPSEVARMRLMPHPASDEAWGALVAELRRTFKVHGVVSEVGRVREWASAVSEDEVPTRVTLEPEGTGMRLSITQRPGPLVLAIAAIPGVLAVLLALGLTLSGRSAAGALALALLASLFLAGRLLYGASVRKEGRRFEAVLDRAETLIAGQSGSRAAASAAADAEGPRLNFDALPEDDGSNATTAAGRRGRARS